MCFHVGFKEEIVLENHSVFGKGNQDVTTLLLNLHPDKLRTDFPGLQLKQFIFKECTHMQAHTKSMKSREETEKK